MIIRQIVIVTFALLLTSMLPFFKPFHEPVKMIYRSMFPW